MSGCLSDFISNSSGASEHFFLCSGLCHACYILRAPSGENCNYGLLSDPTLIISFVLAENPVAILIKVVDLGKLAINDKVLINSYKWSGVCSLLVDVILRRSLYHFTWAEVQAGSNFQKQCFLVITEYVLVLRNLLPFQYKCKVVCRSRFSFIHFKLQKYGGLYIYHHSLWVMFIQLISVTFPD